MFSSVLGSVLYVQNQTLCLVLLLLLVITACGNIITPCITSCFIEENLVIFLVFQKSILS